MLTRRRAAQRLDAALPADSFPTPAERAERATIDLGVRSTLDTAATVLAPREVAAR